MSGLDGHPTIPAGLKQAGRPEQQAFIYDIAQAVVEKCTLVDEAFSLTSHVEDIGDGVYNYFVTLEPC